MNKDSQLSKSSSLFDSEFFESSFFCNANGEDTKGIDLAIQKTFDDMWNDKNCDYEAFRGIEQTIATLDDLKKRVDDLDYDRLIILGMGASITNPAALIKSANLMHKRIAFISDLNDDSFDQAVGDMDPKRCCFFVISKSGSTLETVALTFFARQWLIEKKLPVAQHLIIMKEPGQSLLSSLEQHDRLIPKFVHPPIGGRFASFTPVTLVPGFFAGLDMKAFLEGASLCLKETQNLGQKSAVGRAVLGHMLSIKAGRNLHIIESYDASFSGLSEWWCQLWGESLGKNSNAITPLRSVGPFDHHSQWQLYLSAPQNKYFTFLAPIIKNDGKLLMDYSFAKEIGADYFKQASLSTICEATFQGAKSALDQCNVPYIVWLINSESTKIHSIGYFMMHTILTILAVGRLTQCNPFGQPAVESLKNGALQYMKSKV